MTAELEDLVSGQQEVLSQSHSLELWSHWDDLSHTDTNIVLFDYE